MTTKTIDLNRFKNAVGFTATFRKWGNARKGNIAKITTSEDSKQDQQTKERVKITKQLIKAKEYEAIVSFQGEIARWLYTNTVPSFFKEGFQLTGLDGVERIDARMRTAQTELAGLVEALIAVYPDKIKEAEAALGAQFNPRDYPAAESLRALFSIQWNWVSFTVPEGLPAELRQVESEKLERQFADAGEQILQALRTGFQDLIAHAVDRLTSEPGEKPKVFRDSLIGNIREFIETFNQRNLMNDVELSQLVAKAKTVLDAGSINAQKLRDYAQIKDNTREQFAEIKSAVDKMIIERPSRKFDFTADDDTAPEAAPAQAAA